MKYLQLVKLSFTIIISMLLISTGSSAFQILDPPAEVAPVRQTTQQPSPENVYNDIDTISGWYRYLGTPGHEEAENYIFSKFQGFGLNTTRQEYTAQRVDGNIRACNVLGLLEGITDPSKWLVIGGHYDANKYATHGAYDNAVGAATVIELARFFTEYYKTNDGPDTSIMFATWDAEEGGGAGSKHFVENIPDEIDVTAYINLDMYCLNYPIKNGIPGSNEEYYILYLYTSPVQDFSGYGGYDFNDAVVYNYSVFQDMLINITYDLNGYPPEWVIVQDDTEANSDHKFFVQNSIPAVWFRGMHEYPKDEGDFNERNFKHTPADTLQTMERYAGGKSQLLEGINIGLVIAYQLGLEVLNLSAIHDLVPPGKETKEEGRFDNMSVAGWLIAAAVAVIIIIFLYFSRIRSK